MSPMSDGHCGCRNHRGKPKPMHKGQQRAIEAILHQRYDRNMGGAKAYPCPRRPGVWHVASGRHL